MSEVFGNKFLLETDGERVLVTTGPDWYHRLDVRAGEELSVTGEQGEDGTQFAGGRG